MKDKRVGEDADLTWFFEAADEAHVKRERARGRELRNSQWWKNQLGRGQCHYCRRRVPVQELTMDHVVPVIRGGSSTRGNVVPACKECNTRKKNLLPSEWQEYLDHLSRQAVGKRPPPAHPPAGEDAAGA